MALFYVSSNAVDICDSEKRTEINVSEWTLIFKTLPDMQQLDEGGDNEELLMCFYIIIINYYEYLQFYKMSVCLSCEKYY